MLGWRSIEEMERTMSAVELQRWTAYFQYIEPIPNPTRDAAMICWVLALINHDKGPRPRLEDFMPKAPLAAVRRQTAAEMRAAFERNME